MEQESLHSFYTSLLNFLLSSKRLLIGAAKTQDLTFIQAVTLMLIDTDTAKPMNVLQKIHGCDASNITGIVDGLEEKGLVTRGEDPKDRRVKVIGLTKKGVGVRDAIYADIIKLDGVIFSGLDQTELSQFRAIVTKLSVH